MSKSDGKFMVKKIDLEELIYTLTDLWNKGVDYIDITSSKNDRLAIFFSEDYLSEEAKEELMREESTDISDLDINQII